ncbi:MAG: TraM recognition domain-containing protein [Elusimicrobiota bacterium]
MILNICVGQGRWGWESFDAELIYASFLCLPLLFLSAKNKATGFLLSLGITRLCLAVLPHFKDSIPKSKVSLIDHDPIIFVATAIGLGVYLLLCISRIHLGNKAAYPVRKFLKDAKKAACQGNFILGIERKGGFLFRKSVVLAESARCLHGQVVGSSGSGKTQLTLALAFQDMLRGWPVFFMENKGDSRDFGLFYELAKSAGRERDVIKIDFFDPASKKLNPIKLPGNPDPLATTNQIMLAIGREPGGSSESEFYKHLDNARVLDMAKIFHASGQDLSLRRAYLFFSNPKFRKKTFFACEDHFKTINAAKARLGTEAGDLTAITTHLYPWASGILGKTVNPKHPDLVIEDIFNKKLLAYVLIPIGDLRNQTNALGKMMIELLLACAQKRQRNGFSLPASIILEEFSEFVTKSFSTLVSTARSAGFCLTLSHQDFGQLRRVEDMDKDAFVSNVNANTAGFKVFFNAVNDEDAEKMAKMFGTYTEAKKTRRIKVGLTGAKSTGDYSERETESFHIHPNEFKRLKAFKAGVKAGDMPPKLVATPAVYGL